MPRFIEIDINMHLKYIGDNVSCDDSSTSYSLCPSDQPPSYRCMMYSDDGINDRGINYNFIVWSVLKKSDLTMVRSDRNS